MELLKNFAMLLAAAAIPAVLVLTVGALSDALPVLGWIVTVIVLAVAIYLLTCLVKAVRGK